MLRQKQLLGHFLGAVAANNLAKQSLYLRKIYCSPLAPKSDCFDLVFANLLRHRRSINVHDLRKLLNEFPVDAHAAPNAVRCLLHAYANFSRQKHVGSAMKRYAVSFYVRSTVAALATRPQLEQWLAEDPVAVSAFNEIEIALVKANKVKTPMVLPPPTPPPPPPQALDIDARKHNGLITMDQMLQYIATPFRPGPLAAQIDSLTDSTRQSFWEEYRRFSRVKQLNVELNAANVALDLPSNSLFLRGADIDIKAWADALAAYLEHEPQEPGIARFYDYVRLLGFHWLATVAARIIFTHTIKSPTHSTPVTNVLLRIASVCKRRLATVTGMDPPLVSADYLVFLAPVVAQLMQIATITISSAPNDFLDVSPFHVNDNVYSVFRHTMERKADHTTGVIEVNPYIFNRVHSFGMFSDNGVFTFPMVHPPKPWVSPQVGGFLSDSRPLVVRKEDDGFLAHLDSVSKNNQLDFIYQNLDYINSAGWLMNENVLAVMEQVSQIEEGLLSVPKFPEMSASMSIAERKTAIARRVKRDKFESVVQLAKSYSNNVVYFSHQLDFRGRIYPSVSLLTYYDEDYTRSLFLFAEAKPLGPSGLKWLQYQLAGLYGLDKSGMDERLQFVQSNMVNILQSAENPLKSTWWQQADEPWQTLAMCFELRAIEEFSKSDKVENYRCRMPIHMDGSCNGLQHYAALGRDSVGANSVNLLPSDTKQDVYGEVLALVKQKLSASDTAMDQLLLKVVARKTVKRPVMTYVYGVTRWGASRHIKEELDELKPGPGLAKEEIDAIKADMFPHCFRVAQLVFESIGDLFSSAVEIQKWLQNNCLRIMLSIGPDESDSPIDFIHYNNLKPFTWTSPTGLPIVQLYHKTNKKRVHTSLQSMSLTQDSKEYNISKQLNAVAANFIHSLDSVHMFLTCDSCRRAEIPFVAVHDSYWTSPCHVEELNAKLRHQFIQLHSENLIQNLREELQDTTKSSYSLLFICNEENSQLVEEIRRFRKSSLKTDIKANSVLNQEINDPDALAYLQSLIDKYQPKLYLKRQNNLVALDDVTVQRPFGLRSYTPVLTKLHIQEPPETGDLDIGQVGRSQFFFS